MKLKLASGEEIRVGVTHKFKDKRGRRGTKVWLRHEGEGEGVEVVAVCSTQDNFSKSVGRRLAAHQMLELLRNEEPRLTKADRRAVFEAVCPEYAASRPQGGKR